MRYSCEVYTDPDVTTRVRQLLSALPRDHGYWYRIVHAPGCPCEPRGLERAPLGDCTCGTVLLEVADGPSVGVPTGRVEP